jgi:hypothetical protein
MNKGLQAILRPFILRKKERVLMFLAILCKMNG